MGPDHLGTATEPDMDLSGFTTDALVSSEFRDSYLLEVEKLEALYSKSKRHQWNAETDIDWSRFEPDADASHVDFEGLVDPVAQTVIPNLTRVGLVPERLVDGYLAQGFRVDVAGQRVEDVHTFHADTRAARRRFAEEQVDFSEAAQVSPASGG